LLSSTGTMMLNIGVVHAARSLHNTIKESLSLSRQCN
jgi:hypothetical protein